jgi:hypothetical protein
MAHLVTNDLSNYVLGELAAQGLGVNPNLDIPNPELPTDITVLSDEDLMILYTQFVIFSDFVNTQLSCAIIDEKEMDRQLASLESAKMMKYTASAGAKTSVTAVKALVEDDEDVYKLKIQHLQKYAYRKMLETLANNSERDSAVCSRELTRRTSGDNFKTRSRKFVV